MSEVKMSVKEVAERMGASEQFIRIGLQQGKFPWCSVSPASEYDIEVAKMKGMPIIEIEIKKGGKGRYKDEAENIIHL